MMDFFKRLFGQRPKTTHVLVDETKRAYLAKKRRVYVRDSLWKWFSFREMRELIDDICSVYSGALEIVFVSLFTFIAVPFWVSYKISIGLFVSLPINLIRHEIQLKSQIAALSPRELVVEYQELCVDRVLNAAIGPETAFAKAKAKLVQYEGALSASYDQVIALYDQRSAQRVRVVHDQGFDIQLQDDSTDPILDSLRMLRDQIGAEQMRVQSALERAQEFERRVEAWRDDARQQIARLSTKLDQQAVIEHAQALVVGTSVQIDALDREVVASVETMSNMLAGAQQKILDYQRETGVEFAVTIAGEGRSFNLAALEAEVARTVEEHG